MANKIRTCACCMEKYSYCPNCGEDKDKPTWFFSFCSEKCKGIYDITSKYENGQISANDARAKLDELDLSGIDKFGTSYKTSIEKITSATAVAKIVVEEVVETKDEEIVETVDEFVATETIEEERVIKKSKRAKKSVEVE